MCQPTGGPWRQMLLASCGDLGPGQICLLTHFGQIPCPSGHAPTQERHRGPGEASLEASRPRSLGEGSRASLGASRGVGGGGSRGRPVGSRTCISNQIGKVLWLERGPELPQGPRLRPAGTGGPHGGKQGALSFLFDLNNVRSRRLNPPHRRVDGFWPPRPKSVDSPVRRVQASRSHVV